MRIDRYTKTVLTVIALALSAIAIGQFSPPRAVASPTNENIKFGEITYDYGGNSITFFDKSTGDLWYYGRAFRQRRKTAAHEAQPVPAQTAGKRQIGCIPRMTRREGQLFFSIRVNSWMILRFAHKKRARILIRALIELLFAPTPLHPCFGGSFAFSQGIIFRSRRPVTSTGWLLSDS